MKYQVKGNTVDYNHFKVYISDMGIFEADTKEEAIAKAKTAWVDEVNTWNYDDWAEETEHGEIVVIGSNHYRINDFGAIEQ